MAHPVCDVIGCRAPATWKRSNTLFNVAGVSELLCEDHYAALCKARPILCAHFEQLQPDDANQMTPQTAGS